MDWPTVLKKIGKPQLVVVDGAGHAFFRQPHCTTVFDLAREITREHKNYAGDIPYADEDVINIAMTMLDLQPAPFTDFFARYMSAMPGTMEMDATKSLCRFVAVQNGQPFEPCMVHFAANEASVAYTCQLFALFRKFGVPTRGLLLIGAADFYEREIKMPLSNLLKMTKRLIGQ